MTMTADIDLKIQKYQLSQEEWTTIEHLRDVLKVCLFLISAAIFLFILTSDCIP